MTAVIYVRGRDRERLGEVDDFASLVTVERWNAPGEWTLTLPSRAPMAMALSFAGGIEVVDEYGPVTSGPVTFMDRDEEGRTGTLEVRGRDDLWPLAGRIALPAPLNLANPQAGLASGGYDVQRGSLETVLRSYVDRNAGPGALVDRRAPGLILAPDQGRGGSYVGRPERFENLLTYLARAATARRLAFRVVQRGQDLVFELYPTRDLSQDVVLGIGRKNLLGYRLTVEAPEANAVYCGGPGEAQARVMRTGWDRESLTAFGRREVFLDQRSAAADPDTGTTVVELLDQAVAEELVEQSETASVELRPVDTADTMYRRDYQLGDTVSVELDETGARMTEQVGAVRRELTPDGYRITPTVASDGQDLTTRGFIARMRRTARRLTVMEGI